jgi:hypothetical protein
MFSLNGIRSSDSSFYPSLSIGHKKIYEVANYGSAEINGLFLCTPIIPMTLKIRGTVSLGAVYWYVYVTSPYSRFLH